MLVYHLKNNKIIKQQELNDNQIPPESTVDNPLIYLFADEPISADVISIITKSSKKAITSELSIHNPRFESHDNLDLICAKVINFSKNSTPSDVVHIFLQKESLIIACSNISGIEEIFQKINTENTVNLNFGRILWTFFEQLIAQNNSYIESFENRVNQLDEDVLLKKQRANFITDLMKIRKQLMYLKRFYQQLSDIFSFIDENDNEFFDDKTIKLFKILDNKADRLYSNVISLSDYISQIREAYQSDIDINLNKTMNLCTIIASIFMPLTLITGWYGMNLKMPEYAMPYAYPVVVTLSVLIVIGCIIYFKKRKWFM
ncbi:MAG: CorA family divalent cation transporter [Clostridia bacterium]